ncbi:MAG: ArsR/SmtB family transcription factor [Haloferacaceae archaeon]
MSKAWDPDDIFDVLASEDVRRILVATSVRPMSAKELADICDRSLATIYRRIQAMEDYDLLSEELTRDPDGTQYNEYRSDLNEITISVDEGQLNVNIDIEKDTVDQFAELIEDLEGPEKQDESGSDE